jgi:thiamine-phosphate diphosphorylase/hydroxyethylthiazole kinase
LFLQLGLVNEGQTSKTNTKDIIGTAGTKEILRAIAEDGRNVRTVSIGGINASTVQRVLFQSSDSKKKLDGVAVVSAIIAAQDPKRAAEEIINLIKTPPPFAAASLANTERNRDPRSLLEVVPAIIKAVAEKKPLSHNMTNLVVQNFAANVALAVGRFPSSFLAPPVVLVFTIHTGTLIPSAPALFLP